MDEAVHIAADAGLPFTGLRGVPLDARLIDAVPLQWARRERVVPLGVSAGRLTLAASRPDPDLGPLLAALPELRGVDVVIAPEHEIDAALARAVTDPVEPRRLGDRLVAHGLATAHDVEQALAEQKRTGGRLGDVLAGWGAVSEHDLQAVLAEHLQLPVVDLAGDAPDDEALVLVPEELQRRLRCVPLAVDEDVLYLACAEPFDEDERALLRERTGLEPREFLAPGREVDALLLRLHGAEWADAARRGLSRRFPAESSVPVATPLQVVAAVTLFLAAGAALVLTPSKAAIALAGLAAAVTVPPALYALVLAFFGVVRRRRRPAARLVGPLPRTTVLLALEDRPDAARRADVTLAALEHPPARLEVLLLAREDEPTALAAAAELAERPLHRLVPVPAIVPPTDAGTLAFGLLLARGEHVAALSSGDVPDSGLLTAAACALAAAGPRAAVAQAQRVPLPARGLVAGWSAVEHGVWHDLLAPVLGRRRRPLPLALDGVVARTAAMREAGGWDACADPDGPGLGVRLHKAGFRAVALDGSVAVAPCSGPADWLESRAACWRGLAQAWLVALRHPWLSLRRIGVGATLSGAVLGAGAVLAPLAWPGVLLAVGAGALDQVGALDGMLPRTAVLLATATAACASVTVLVLALAAALRRRSRATAAAALLAPVAWTAGALAAWLGLAELVARIGRRAGGRRAPW